MFDHYEGGALLAIDRSQPLFEIGEHGGIDAAGRFVEQHQPWTAHERHGGIEQLLLAVRQATGRLAGEMIEFEEPDHLVGCFGQPGVGGTEQPRYHVAPMLLAGEDEVFAHRQLWKHLKQLKGAADPEAIELGRTEPGDDFAVDLDLSGARHELAENTIEQRRLSASVGPDQPKDLTLQDVEADAVDRRDAAKALSDIADFKHRGHRAVSNLDLARARSADAALVRRSVR